MSVGKSRVITRFARLSSILARTLLVTSGIVFIPSQIFFAATPAHAAPGTTQLCTPGVGNAGTSSSTLSLTKGGNGCVVIKYTVSGTTSYETFNYTGADQTWTVPTGVSSASLYILAAGGGGGYRGTSANGLQGGGGGLVTGNLAVTVGDQYTIIVGQGGGGVVPVKTTPQPTGMSGCYWTPATYGGGGASGSCFNPYQQNSGYASGGGRSAIRKLGTSTDIATAGGGGGGSWGGVGGVGGGTTGGSAGGGGGTQTTGGAGGTSANGWAGLAGAQYLGGNAFDEGGGGGGGCYGGGGGGDNTGGGGGSSCVGTLTSGATTSAVLTAAAQPTDLSVTITYDANGATGGSVPTPTSVVGMGVATATLAGNTGTLVKTNYTFAGWIPPVVFIRVKR